MNNLKQQKFECALGFHEYTIPDKKYPHIKICKHCKTHGYHKSSNGDESWYEYDNKGNMIHWKDNEGYECRYEYDKNGNRIHYKTNEGTEEWLNNSGYWTTKKPKNWKYESK